MVASNNKDLNTLLVLAVQAAGYTLWGYEWIGGHEHRCLRVYIDDPHGITVEDCAKASHQVSAALAVDEPVSGDYQLEVSSPGLDRPLYALDHYRGLIGTEIKLQLRRGNAAGQRRFRGIIAEVNEDHIRLNTDEGSEEIVFGNIEKARVIVPWKTEKK
ncbi:MAG: hypothetical protein K0R12_584 [Gammaproteobacteria bacterium]|jgi:ribosome maturation factor RimP|nr:hypothetical protein [Gammaproteobacteria bacterium]